MNFATSDPTSSLGVAPRLMMTGPVSSRLWGGDTPKRSACGAGPIKRCERKIT